jgi:predicted ATPase
MLERLYVHNYRCLENFEFKPGPSSSVLLIGKNGAGKSTIRQVLAVLQAIGLGEGQVKNLVKESDFTRGRSDAPMRFEVTLNLGGQRYHYALALELPASFRQLRVLSEALSIDGAEVYSRQHAEVKVRRDAADGSNGLFSMDWHIVALTVIQDRGASKLLQPLRDWLSRVVLLSPLPPLMVSETTAEPEPLQLSGSNLVDWLSSLLETHPSVYTTVIEQVQKVMPDVALFRFEKLGRDSRALMVQFKSGGASDEQPFDRLSDGEKCFFLSAVLLAANRWAGPLFAFWDEPDNYLATHEVGQFIVELKRCFAQHGGQWIASSHNADAVVNFSVDSTWVLARKSHLEPTQSRCVDDLPLPEAGLIQMLMDGEIDTWL